MFERERIVDVKVLRHAQIEDDEEEVRVSRTRLFLRSWCALLRPLRAGFPEDDGRVVGVGVFFTEDANANALLSGNTDDDDDDDDDDLLSNKKKKKKKKKKEIDSAKDSMQHPTNIRCCKMQKSRRETPPVSARDHRELFTR